MADKELRRLKRRELLEMLLVQCQETERLQAETDEMREQLNTVMESYERLKKKLDIKDERLNQKDAMIAELKGEMEEMKKAREAEQDDVGSVAGVSYRLNAIFEEAQKAAEQHLAHIQKLREKAQKVATHRMGEKQNPFGMGKISSLRKHQNMIHSRQIITMGIDQPEGRIALPDKSESKVKQKPAVGGIHG